MRKVKINIWNIPEDCRYIDQNKLLENHAKKKQFNLQYFPFFLKKKKNNFYCVLVTHLHASGKKNHHLSSFNSSSNNNRRFFPKYSPQQIHPNDKNESFSPMNVFVDAFHALVSFICTIAMQSLRICIFHFILK